LHLSEVRIRVGDGPGAVVPIATAIADFNQSGWDISRAIDGNPATAWGIYPAVGQAHEAVFILKDSIPGGSRVTVELDQLYGEGPLIGRARLSATSDPTPTLTAKPIPNEIAAILAVSADKRTDAQRKDLTRHVLLARLETEMAELPKPRQVYAATTDFDTIGNFRPSKGARTVHVLQPGEGTKPGALSGGHGPSALPVADLANEAQRRAALAKWLTDRENGLVWRSIVNRVWHYHIGRGIVATPNDFGRMGAAPTHPELLDWLAAWFRDSGGSLKALHRLIVTSETYRQSSAHNPDF